LQTIIEYKPCYLLEAANLTFGLINDIPMEELVGTGTYAIAQPDAAVFCEKARALLEPRRKALEYYFRPVYLGADRAASSYLASCMLFSNQDGFYDDPAEMTAVLLRMWNMARQNGWRVTNVSGNSLNLEPDPNADPDAPMSLAQELSSQNIPVDYKLKLVEAFTAYEYHLNRLLELLQPVLDLLPEFLAPWVQRAIPLAEEWADFFQDNSPKEFFRKSSGIVSNAPFTITMRFRYFIPGRSIGRIWTEKNILLFHLGIEESPRLKEESRLEMKDEEFERLRLMGNPARARMLKAMMTRAMTNQELSQHLGLNPGSVHRDLSSLLNAKLLNLEVGGGKTYYRTDFAAIQSATERFLQFLLSGNALG